MRMRVFCPLLLVAIASGQDQPVIQVGTRLVQFNVVVRDRNGPISDLKKEDFTVKDRGTRRDIAVFHVDSRSAAAPGQASVAKRLAAAPNEFSNQSPLTVNSTILLFDGVNTEYADQMYARLQIIKFIEHLKPGDRIAIYSLGHEIRVIHEFSSDVSSLLEAAKALRIRISEGDVDAIRAAAQEHMGLQASGSTYSSGLPGSIPAGLAGMISDMSQSAAEVSVNERLKKTELALLSIARYFSSAPGRKSLVWVSSGFPASIGLLGRKMQAGLRFDSNVDSAAQALMDANVAVYPVDARGLMGDSKYTATVSDKVALARAPLQKLPPGYSEHIMMTDIAESTGGLAFYDANNVQGAIRKALDDSDVTYTLGFYVPKGDMDARFHETRITVARKGAEVRTRAGYIAYKDTTPSESTREIVMRQALYASFDATALPVTVRVSPGPTPRAIVLTLMFDPRTLVISQKDNGKFTGAMDFVIAQQGADGHDVKVDADVLNLSYTPERYQQIISHTLSFRRPVDLQPETRMIRVMFYDRNSGLVGSARGSVRIEP